MSNQRPGKTHRAAASDNTNDMRMRNFFRTCAELFSSLDNDEVAAFCETIMEEYNAGRQLPSNPKDIQRLFGL
jgi:hypothetical protein